MAAQYLLRFDDICPTMNWGVWGKIEAILCENDIIPILAVVPENRDEALVAGEHNDRFWPMACQWHRRGWTIGMHGFRHEFVTRDAGMLSLNHYSEFAGLELSEQEAKLNAAKRIFESYGIVPEVWVAPAHSFDVSTLCGLGSVGLSVISDGYALWPYVDANGILWLPQQLWRFRHMPFGVWTVCFHINGWSSNDIRSFESAIKRYRFRITSFDAVRDKYQERKITRLDRAFSKTFLNAIKTKRMMNRRRK
jgi:hypothetical protein